MLVLTKKYLMPLAVYRQLRIVGLGCEYQYRFLCNLQRNFSASTTIANNHKNDKLHPDWVTTGKPGTGGDHPSFKKIDLSFENVKEAYKSKSNFELLRAILVFRLCSIEKLVANQRQLLSFGEKILGRRILERILKMTFYGHFVAGADVKEIKPVIEKYRKFGVKSILDYSVEEDVAGEKKVENLEAELPKSDSQESSPVIRQFRSPVSDISEGVVSARTFIYEDEKACDDNMQHFIECINAVAEATQASGFAAVKVTALGRPELLMHISEVLIRIEDYYKKLSGAGENPDDMMQRISEYQFRKGLTNLGIPISRDDSKQWFTWLDNSKEGQIDIFEWSNLLNADIHKVMSLPSVKTYTDSLGRKFNVLAPLIPKVDPEMDQQFRNMVNRLNKIVEHAASRDVRVMIDAEQSYFQPAINRLAMEMMRQFNKDKALVFNTYQAYTRSALRRCQLDLALSAKEDFYFGCKLVRGAYIEQERARAKELNYPDPTWSNTDETTSCYVRVFEELLRSAKTRPKGKVSLMCATHNEESVRNAILKMKELGINPDDKIVCFGQLMGMCDQVSFTLGQAGFSVYKYIPYGPTFDVMPYLMRRAQENRGIFDKVLKERRLLSSEMNRRLRSGQLVYKPQ